jgi:hypothetical protein
MFRVGAQVVCVNFMSYRHRGTGMGYAAIGLGILGFAVGLTFRLKALLLFVGLVLIASIVFSIGSRFHFLHALLTIMVAQTILQSCYFLGLAARAFFSTHRMRHVF